MTTDAELRHLDRCVELATEALEAGDEPFGSVLVAADGTVLAEDRNRPSPGGDSTRHPEDRAERGSYVGCIAEFGVPPSPVRTLAIEDVTPGLTVQGPVPDLAEAVHDLIRRWGQPGRRISSSS